MLKDNIKKLRKEKKLTQLELASKIDIALRTYSNYENGSVEPNIKTLIKLADFFEISVDYLIEHRQNNKIDLSGLTKTQKKIIDITCQLNEIQAGRVESYAIAKLEEQQDMQMKYDNRGTQ